ncbi:lysine-specific demethylase 5A-like [Paramacrobiotus metropolitanus]|uniref:lysine-specific demethylase 5A-like n=1 Tax=Paramacrobiotus metropolitanus TaxID=2943436 RepID=UPI002445AAFC|nr:lysine-specific demethylase 5A-like [Paramacrobiotus metropolitanus]XP_055342749.1 lysine-specific demethylase 5A-like [Paramacrobiotus metropolitanus]XP_055342750.1 lysine-specific demethylase 5A-like [Paramacrobiotus metropolitanus]
MVTYVPQPFVRPADAPIYYPTEEEFRSPLLYIQTIKEEAEKFGLCKIVPPKSFRPPFAVAKDTFKFKARYQRLSDLDAFSRSRHSFACMLRRFWTDQGWPAELVPQKIGNQVIDWCDLYIAVLRLGGFRAVSASADGWAHVASVLRIDYAGQPSAIKDLKALYEKNLLPYDEFRTQVELYLGKDHLAESLRKNPPVNKSAGCRRLEKKSDKVEESTKTDETKIPSSEISSCAAAQETADPGAENSSRPDENGDGPDCKKEEKRVRARRSTSQVCYSEMVCEVCKQTDDYDNLKFCEKCETTYHLKCIPAAIRKDKAKLWLCPRCMKETYDGLRSCHTYGFETSNTLYTLDEFQKKADNFKKSHFGSTTVGLQEVEKEFWRLLGDPNGETVVEYGADLHRGELGSSGFPTESDRPYLRDSEKEYIDHPWNLNKLPDNELSILRHITAQISGMKTPWMYVGMVFSAFCWHTEDHWSASINYLHMGDPKTWYGVPGSYAEEFEKAFKMLVPVLTESNPDLLHQLVTHMNPTVLNCCGVPIYRMDQRAGEFIVTFPRAYHAGFNQGFNFAEAVNFCLADWIPHGRLSINHYSNCKRELVFSHDELICAMADQASLLHQTIAKACHTDFLHMVEEESASRQNLTDKGIVLDDEPTLFEFMDDHERSCSICHTTLFLSAVQCECSNEKLACGKHAEQLCTCGMESKRLLYRYTIEDLKKLLERLLKRSEEEDSEEYKPPVAAITGNNGSNKRAVTGADAKAGKRQKLSQDSPMDFFGDFEGSANNELKAAMKMAAELVSPQTITRGRDAGDISPAVKRWKLEDVEGLISSLLAFPGTSKEVSHIREYLRKYYNVQSEIRGIMQTKPEDQDFDVVRRVYDQARSTNIVIESLEDLQLIVQQTDFRERVAAAITDPRTTIGTLAEVLQTADEIYIRNPYIEDLVAAITKLIDEGRNLEIDAENIVSHRKQVTVGEAKGLIDRADAYTFDLKHVDHIRDGVEIVEKLADALQHAQASNQRIHMQEIRNILGSDLDINFHGGNIGVALELYKKGNEFLEKLHKLFFGNGATDTSHHETTLLEVLCPRQVHLVRGGETDDADTDTDEHDAKNSGTVDPEMGDPLDMDSKCHPFDLDLNDHYDVGEVTSLFERACWDEQIFYERLRESNCLKSALDSDSREESAQLRRELRWCVCGNMQQGTMIQCDSCFDWFHVSCTRMAEFICDDGTGEFGLVHQLVESIQFMCDMCQRGIRPHLDQLKKLVYEHKGIQRFITIPEMDLACLVIARAERWRLSAANVINELPSIVHQVNTACERDEESRVRRRTRDAVLALLLEGNLLEVKVPEWLFLYDFVHENFRKDRQEDDPPGPMILPARSYGRFPIAVDMISPLFRQLSKTYSRPAVVAPDMNHSSGHTIIESAMGNGKNGKPGGRKRNAWCNRDGGGNPTPGRSPRKQNGEVKSVNAFASTSPAKLTPRRRRMENCVAESATLVESNGDLNNTDTDGAERCYLCHGAFPPDQLPSTIYNSRIVAMCANCKKTQLDTTSKAPGETHAPIPTRNSPRRQRLK